MIQRIDAQSCFWYILPHLSTEHARTCAYQIRIRAATHITRHGRILTHGSPAGNTPLSIRFISGRVIKDITGPRSTTGVNQFRLQAVTSDPSTLGRLLETLFSHFPHA